LPSGDVADADERASRTASDAILARAVFKAVNVDDDNERLLQSAEHKGLDTSMCSGVSPSEF